MSQQTPTTATPDGICHGSDGVTKCAAGSSFGWMSSNILFRTWRTIAQIHGGRSLRRSLQGRSCGTDSTHGCARVNIDADTVHGCAGVVGIALCLFQASMCGWLPPCGFCFKTIVREDMPVVRRCNCGRIFGAGCYGLRAVVLAYCAVCV